MEQKVKLEEEVAALQAKIKEGVNSNRELQRRLNENEKRIGNLATNPEEVKEIRLLNEEVRVSKEKLRELKQRYDHEKRQGDAAAEKLQVLENSAREKGINLTVTSPNKRIKGSRLDEDEPKQPPVESSDIRNLRSSLTDLENQRKEVELKARRRLQELETECKYYIESKEKAAKSLKEKEQESRIKEYEIKELKRNIRALRLKEGSLASAPDLLADSKEEEKEEKSSTFKTDIKANPVHRDKVENSIAATKKKIEDMKEEMKPREQSSKQILDSSIHEEERPERNLSKKSDSVLSKEPSYKASRTNSKIQKDPNDSTKLNESDSSYVKKETTKSRNITPKPGGAKNEDLSGGLFD